MVKKSRMLSPRDEQRALAQAFRSAIKRRFDATYGHDGHKAADNLVEAIESIFPPWHNQQGYAGDEAQALRLDMPASMQYYTNVPRIDIDPQVGLQLMMGISDDITVRRELPSWVKQPGAEETSGVDSAVFTYLKQEREKLIREGKPLHTVVILRFPKHFRQNRVIRSDGITDANNIEMPVVVDLSGWKEWEASDLFFTDGDPASKAKADSVAQTHGFADARGMIKSRSLQLSHTQLQVNEARQGSHDKAVRLLEAKIQRLSTSIETIERKRDVAKAKIDKLLRGDYSDYSPEEQEVIRAAEAQIPALQVKIDAENLAISSVESQIAEVGAWREDQRKQRGIGEKDTSSQQFHVLKREYSERLGKLPEIEHTHSVNLGVLMRNQTRLKRKTTAALISGLEYVVRDATYALEGDREPDSDNSVRKLGFYRELEQARSELEKLRSTPLKKDRTVATDANPNLLTLPVLAANAKEFQLYMDKEDLAGRQKYLQITYQRDVFPLVMDSVNGWLVDSLRKEPHDHYLRGAHRYFELLHQEHNRATGDNFSFEEFVSHPGTKLSNGIAKLYYGALSHEEISDFTAEGQHSAAATKNRTGRTRAIAEDSGDA